MQQPNAHPRDLAGELDHQLRRQERQLVVVRLVVVALALAFLVVFGEPIEGRFPIMLLLGGVAGYSVLIGLASRRLPIRPVAALGVTLDAIAVAGVVRLATNVPDSYLFFGVVILGVAVRFGMVASVAASAAISAAYLAIVVATPALDDFTGEWLPVRILFLVIFGVVAGMFSALVSRHAAENVLLQQRLEAEQRERDLAEDQIAREQHAQRVKDDFLSVVSHELRTPLTSIQGYSQLLESRLRAAGSGGRELGHVRVILSQVARMRRLVDDLLDVNRMDRRGGVSIEPVEFDLSHLLREAVGRTARAAPDRVINLEVPPSIAVRLDRERIDQVVGNLLENALKYSPEGGPVRVVALDDAGEV